MDNIHVDNQITEYVLGLLSEKEQTVVAYHIARCEACRLAVQQERKIGRLVHSTLNKATTPDYGRLQSLMPSIPNRRTSILALLAPYRQWAVACLLLVFMMGAFLFGGNGIFGHLTQPTANQQATISFANIVGTAETITTTEAGTVFSLAAQPTVPIEQSRIFTDGAPEEIDIPTAPQPVAPQVTPAPAATYFQ